ncbi:hypothetical protein CCR75_001614 [Bremia lactucae]|uniref:Uncharacterized protein n=1 Tax=Bremia lactucae TaxID=4779 RepID=A0A976IFS6_BRELC|nr:hypothetical protein CCR75_001614 [Bremia lactucae]
MTIAVLAPPYPLSVRTWLQNVVMSYPRNSCDPHILVTWQMGLFNPELLVGILLVFVQLRLRSYFSIATWLVNNLTFFLPPEDELIATLNGQPVSKGSKTAVAQPLSAAEKMEIFYIRVAKTEHGVFNQTLFYELYEMFVVLVSSATIGSFIGSILTFVTPWVTPEATDHADVITYGLVSALLVALYFPLQLNFAQGWAGYEARLGLAIGFLGFILSGFLLFAPKGLFDFNVEAVAPVPSNRVILLLRAVGFTDADLVRLSPFIEVPKVSLYVSLTCLAAVFTCTTFLPSFRFARMYSAMIQDKQVSVLQKAFLHLNSVFPMLLSVLWIPCLSSHFLVPFELVKCSPRALTRDCLESDVLGLTRAMSRDIWSWYSLTESQFQSLRIDVVLFACLVRLLCFRLYIQTFLLEPRAFMTSLVCRPGLVNGAVLQNKVRLQFNYVPIIALQYLAPVGVLLTSALLYCKHMGTSLGISKCFKWVLEQFVPDVSIPPASLTLLPDPNALPDLGGFRLGAELNSTTVTLFLRGMSHFSILTADVYAAVLGFVIAFVSFTMVAVTCAGLVYSRHTAHGGIERELPTMRQNKQTPKTQKNQLKRLKVQKKTK